MDEILLKLEKQCKDRFAINNKGQINLLPILLKLCENNQRYEIIKAYHNNNKLILKAQILECRSLCQGILDYKVATIINETFLEKLENISKIILKLKINSVDEPDIFDLTNNLSVKFKVADVLLAIKCHHDSEFAYEFFNVSANKYLEQDEVFFQNLKISEDTNLLLGCQRKLQAICQHLREHSEELAQKFGKEGQAPTPATGGPSSLESRFFPRFPLEMQEARPEPDIPEAKKIGTAVASPKEVPTRVKPYTRATLAPRIGRKDAPGKRSIAGSRFSLRPRDTSVAGFIGQGPPKGGQRSKSGRTSQIAPVTQAQFNSLPGYMKGRATLGDVNALISNLNQGLRAKYEIVENGCRPGGLAKMRKESLDYFFEYRTELGPGCNADSIDKYTVTEEDLSRFVGRKLDKKAHSYIVMLRHLKMIKEERMNGAKVRYVVLPPS